MNRNSWSLGHVYDVTKYVNAMVNAKKFSGIEDENGECLYKYGYFLCRDVRDVHVYRIQVGINMEYEKEPRTKIIETENISHGTLLDYCLENYALDYSAHFKGVDDRKIIDFLLMYIGLENILKSLVAIDYENGFENFDVSEYRYDTSIEALREIIDGGYGITEINLEVEEAVR